MPEANLNLQKQTVRQHKRGESGQTMLEFALMLPFLLLLGVGIVEIGRAIFITIIVNNAATAGAEFGSQNSSTASNYQGMTTAATNDSLGNTLGGTMNVTPTPTWGCYCDTAGTSGISCPNTITTADHNACGQLPETWCPAPSQVVECVQVNTTETFTGLFHYPGLPGSYTANGKAVMRVRK